MPMSDTGVSARPAPETEFVSPSEKSLRRTWIWCVEDVKHTHPPFVNCHSQLKIKLRTAMCQLITLQLLLYSSIKFLTTWAAGVLSMWWGR